MFSCTLKLWLIRLASAAAEDYAEQIKESFPSGSIPRFDILLLGMGPDGHTCSLFPGHPLLKETNKLIAEIVDSPKPPPKRVTMTYPLINNAKNCVFALCGKEKADMVKVKQIITANYFNHT